MKLRPRGPRAPVRGRTIALALLAVVLLAILVRASGWTPFAAHEPLPITAYEPTRHADPTTRQTLANGTFEAGGGRFAWEVAGYPEMTGTGVQSFRYHLHRVGGEPARVWPVAALMLDARGGNLGETPLGGAPAVEGGVLVVRQGLQPRGPGVYELTAVLQLDVVREAAWGFVKEDLLTVSLRFETRSAPFPRTSEAPS